MGNEVCHQGGTAEKQNRTSGKGSGTETQRKQPGGKKRQPQLAVMVQQGTMLNHSGQLQEAESEPLFITTIINVFELVRPLIWKKKHTKPTALCCVGQFSSQ